MNYDRFKNHNRPLTIIYKKVVELHENPRNPRKHSRKQLMQIAASICKFGLVLPLLVDANGMVIEGNACFRAAIDLGFEEVPCVLVDHLSPEEIRALIIALKRLAENSEWDTSILAEELTEIRKHFDDFDAIGFTVPEIDRIVAKANEHLAFQIDVSEPPVEQPEIPNPYPGDIWLRGDHRFVCLHDRDRVLLAAVMRNQEAKTNPISNSIHVIAIAGKTSSRVSRKRRNSIDALEQIACGWPRIPLIAGAQHD